MAKSENVNRRRDNEFNKIPVFFCQDCLSLNIRSNPNIGDYCEKCGSQNIRWVSLDVYDAFYKSRYNRKLFNLTK